MQNIFVEKPYHFVAPKTGRFLPSLIRDWGLANWHLRSKEGITTCEVRHADRLTESVRAGHGVIVTPNHPRTADPLVMGYLAKEAKVLFYAMASWHLFHKSWFERWVMRTMGAFSVNREGMDRQAVNTAIEALVKAERPLVIFPEGTATRTNDRLTEMLDGISLIARTAAKRRKKEDGGKVVVHPVAIRYVFRGDWKMAIEPTMRDIERRLTFRPLNNSPVVERLRRIGASLLSLKEIEYFGAVQEGSLAERQGRLVERLMVPIEEEWLGKAQTGGIVARIKNVRMAIFPPIARGEVDPVERDRRYRHLADTYLAQQVAFYPTDYLRNQPTVERVIETVERFEEDMTDEARVNAPWHAIVEVGEAIEVSPSREKGGEQDPLMVAVISALETRLAALASEARNLPADQMLRDEAALT